MRHLLQNSGKEFAMDGLTGEAAEQKRPLNELPVGFGMALAMNEQAMQGYAALTETEKEHLILRCRDAGITGTKRIGPSRICPVR